MNPYFATRRTVRRFTEQPVSPDLIREILSRAVNAPNTGNIQLYSVIINDRREDIELLAPFHFNQPAATGCQVMVTFCADCHRYTRWCALSGEDAGCGNLQMLIASVIDAVALAQQFVTIAEMEGLGCCYLGTTAYNADKIASALRMPQLTMPVVTIAVGYPAETPADPGRLPLEAVCHTDRYTDPTDGELHELYAGKESREDSRQFVADNGVDTLAQVFARMRYRKADSEAFSASLHEFLLKQGFKL